MEKGKNYKNITPFNISNADYIFLVNTEYYQNNKKLKYFLLF
jgi:hypothetical protein